MLRQIIHSTGRDLLLRTVPNSSPVASDSLKLSWHLVRTQQPCTTASGRCSMKIVTANYTLADSPFPMQSEIKHGSAHTSK